MTQTETQARKIKCRDAASTVPVQPDVFRRLKEVNIETSKPIHVIAHEALVRGLGMIDAGGEAAGQDSGIPNFTTS